MQSSPIEKMRFFRNPTSLDRFKREGIIRGFISTLLGSILFSLAFLLKFDFENNYSLIPSTALFAFVLGMIFSFIPATVGGYLLASWLFHHPTALSPKDGLAKGAIIGAACMFAEDFVLGVITLPMHHMPSNEMFAFYIISSVLIASLMGAVTGVKLANLLPKYKPQEKPIL